MKKWNVLVSVVDLIDAETEEDAIKDLSDRLARAGFDVYSEGKDAFESEDLS